MVWVSVIALLSVHARSTTNERDRTTLCTPGCCNGSDECSSYTNPTSSKNNHATFHSTPWGLHQECNRTYIKYVKHSYKNVHT